MATHASLTGSDLHEPKGASTATADTVYISNGAGSGAWAKIDSANIDTTSIFDTNKFFLQASIADVSTAETVYVVVPCAATLTAVYTVLHGAITVADSTITIKDHNGNTAGTVTVAYTGSAAGDIDSNTSISSNNTFTTGQKVQVLTDGGSTDAAKLNVILLFTRTG